MRHIAIGDIHGCFDALMTLVDKIPIADSDMIVTLGDYVDRGPRSRDVIDWLIARHAAGTLVPLRGNHEIMMLEAADDPKEALPDWLMSGGDATLKSYANGKGKVTQRDIPSTHWEFILETCRDYYESDTHLFVHANVDGDLPLGDQPEHKLFWEKFHNAPAPHVSGKTLVCGHTPQRDGRPRSIGHAICIDTGAYKDGGWLTALDVATGRYWQANKGRDFRAGWLDTHPS
ncbi:MAG: serine/threonine protein phosphatase [Phycisphaerales bacterium]|nr:serine/threonine protein phosphatase [Phycisphaerales bacterium]MCB9857136.1 serine/threonine protein phosphatase [Phycisphaerales bacterium]MCB9861737.1 serine/threonine protein phosphatase [Phycisphaerales bacterium]